MFQRLECSFFSNCQNYKWRESWVQGSPVSMDAKGSRLLRPLHSVFWPPGSRSPCPRFLYSSCHCCVPSDSRGNQGTSNKWVLEISNGFSGSLFAHMSGPDDFHILFHYWVPRKWFSKGTFKDCEKKNVWKMRDHFRLRMWQKIPPGRQVRLERPGGRSNWNLGACEKVQDLLRGEQCGGKLTYH